jgi:hypothetical protein
VFLCFQTLQTEDPTFLRVEQCLCQHITLVYRCRHDICVLVQLRDSCCWLSVNDLRFIDAMIRTLSSMMTVFVVHFLQVQWPHSNFLHRERAERRCKKLSAAIEATGFFIGLQSSPIISKQTY